MHLNDSIGKEARIQFVCNHHEQASAMAAEAYARVSGLPGVVNVTTGPGGINALNGVFGAWTDSIPMLVVSGQVKRETCMRALGITGLRQLGDQEADIVAMVANITKYAVLVDDPLSIRYHLERAWHLAQGGRPGPCWLDIPVDVQGMSIDPATLRGYDPARMKAHSIRLTASNSRPIAGKFSIGSEMRSDLQSWLAPASAPLLPSLNSTNSATVSACPSPLPGRTT